MVDVWKGTRVDYSNIEYSRRYYPPPRVVLNIILGAWLYTEKKIRLFLPAFRKMHGFNEKKLIAEYIRIITHETFHGIVYHVIASDKWSGSYNPEFPMYHGVDPEYTQWHRRYKGKKRLFG